MVPAHDAAATIEQTLASVAAQSQPAAEVVVVDDASNDDTVERVRPWVQWLPLKVVSSGENVGPSTARHLGVEATSSPLIALLDSDDIWLPDHLETLLGVHRIHGGIALAKFVRWAPGEAWGSAPADVARLPPPDRQLLRLYAGNFAWIATLFERDLYQKAGGFRPGLKVPEEWDLYIRMVRAGARIHRAGHPTVLYRMRPGSLTWDDSAIAVRRQVLEFARQEASDPAELPAIAKGLARLGAEEALVTAYRLAEGGRSLQARRAAWSALRGSRRVAIRGVAMILAPRAVASRRRTARGRPDRRVRG